MKHPGTVKNARASAEHPQSICRASAEHPHGSFRTAFETANRKPFPRIFQAKKRNTLQIRRRRRKRRENVKCHLLLLLLHKRRAQNSDIVSEINQSKLIGIWKEKKEMATSEKRAKKSPIRLKKSIGWEEGGREGGGEPETDKRWRKKGRMREEIIKRERERSDFSVSASFG